MTDAELDVLLRGDGVMAATVPAPAQALPAHGR
jgi:GDPmannose 4,6-dehydratase